MRALKPHLKVGAFFTWVILWIPVQALVLVFFRTPKGYDIPVFWHSCVCKLFGIRVEVAGTPSRAQTLYMCNHLSYLDMTVLAGLLKSSFLARKDGSQGKIFDLLTKLQQCPYIVRTKTAVLRAKNDSEEFLSKGGSLIIFPEGTSTDGRSVRPFKSNLFELAFSEATPGILIQPVTIEVVEADGRPPATQDDRDIYSWHIDMDESITVSRHLWNFAKTSGAKIRVTFHEPLTAQGFEDRKALAKACHERVINGLSAGSNTQEELTHVDIQRPGNSQAAGLPARQVAK